MRVLHARCCGLGVHKRTVVACVLTPDGQQTRTFGPMSDLVALKVAAVARRESGGYGINGRILAAHLNVLEDTGMNVLVANARDIKAVPGRKTDVKDGEWTADLLRDGLIRGSAIPSRARRELRELVRYPMLCLCRHNSRNRVTSRSCRIVSSGT